MQQVRQMRNVQSVNNREYVQPIQIQAYEFIVMHEEWRTVMEITLHDKLGHGNVYEQQQHLVAIPTHQIQNVDEEVSQYDAQLERYKIKFQTEEQ